MYLRNSKLSKKKKLNYIKLKGIRVILDKFLNKVCSIFLSYFIHLSVQISFYFILI